VADIPNQSSLSDPQKVISQLFPRLGFARQGEKVAGGCFTLRQGKTARLLSLILFSLHFHDCPAKGGEIRRLFADKLLLVSHRQSKNWSNQPLLYRDGIPERNQGFWA
jgi:hypothetical protein